MQVPYLAATAPPHFMKGEVLTATKLNKSFGQLHGSRGDFSSGPIQPFDHAIHVRNKTTTDYERGDFVPIDTVPSASMDADEVAKFMRSPWADVSSSQITDAGGHYRPCQMIIAQDDLPSLGSLRHHNRTWSTVNLSVSAQAGDTHVMPDPANPKKGKCSTSGLWKIVRADTVNDVALVDVSQPQNLWRYELLEDWSGLSGTGIAQRRTADARLIGIYGDDFADRVILNDFDNLSGDTQSTGDRGFCMAFGCDFVVITYPCSTPV